MTTTRVESAKHCFFSFYVPWGDLSGAYVPEIYDQYTREYIDLSIAKHKQLASLFDSEYKFFNDKQYCESLFEKYNLPRLGHNDIFNIKFMLMAELFEQYDHITYIDFDVIHKGIPEKGAVNKLKNTQCGIHWTEPQPGYLVYERTQVLCDIFNVSPSRDIWQNNNGVIAMSKKVWDCINYVDTIKKVYDRVLSLDYVNLSTETGMTDSAEFASSICDETMFNFITMYRGIDVTFLPATYNVLIRNEDEFAGPSRSSDFAMMHFTKHTGKEVLNRELRNPNSIIY